MTNWIELLLVRAVRGTGAEEEAPAVALTLRLLSCRPAAQSGEALTDSAVAERWDPMGGDAAARPEVAGLSIEAPRPAPEGLTAAAGDREQENAAALLRLYRRVRAETEPVRPASVREVVRAEEQPAAAALTAEAFDRLICRDSRRYDGGMTIL